MAQDRSDLPEGTDKVISGASGSSSPNSPPGGNRSGSTGGSISGTGAASNETGGSDVLVGSGAATAPEALGGTGTPAGRASQPGASTGTASADRSLVESASSGSGDDEDSSLTDKIRSGGEKLTEQATGKARDLVGQALERSGEALSSVSRMINDTAEGIDDRLGEEYGDYARRAAQSIENTANSIASKDPEELIEDTRNLVRRSPGVALAGAAIVGFALARVIKSSLSSSSGDGRSRNGNES